MTGGPQTANVNVGSRNVVFDPVLLSSLVAGASTVVVTLYNNWLQRRLRQEQALTSNLAERSEWGAGALQLRQDLFKIGAEQRQEIAELRAIIAERDQQLFACHLELQKVTAQCEYLQRHRT
jgi:hypothetical protein